MAARIVLGTIFVAVLCAGWIAPYPYDEQSREESNLSPCSKHLLGTDALGRDRLSRLLYGGRISILAAPAAACISVTLALAGGLVAGLAGGWWERAATTLIDLFLSLPWLFLVLAVRSMLPLNVAPAASIAVTFLLLGLLGWAGPSRVILAAVKRYAGCDFALAATARGSRRWRIAVFQILPNLWPVAVAQVWVTIPAFLLSEANLGLLGLGIAEPTPSWGNLLRELEEFSRVVRRPWMVAPLAVLVVVVSCFHMAVRGEEKRV